MKKVLIGTLLVVLVLSAGATGVFAAGRWQGQNFADADRDGICDYAGQCGRYVDADQDGICDACGTCRNGRGKYFVDADGDGVCDNYTGGAMGRGCGFRGGCNR